MALREYISYIEQLEKELCLVNLNSRDSLPQWLADYFETYNVRIRTAHTSSGKPHDIAVLSTSDTVLSVITAATLRDLLMNVPRTTSGFGIADGGYADILRHLKETTFTSYDAEQLLYVSREIEDRARRVGAGTIYTGFQQLSVMYDQRGIYADLVDNGVAVHAYGRPDTEPPSITGATVHASTKPEIAKMWFVVFDGGGTDSQKTALVAEERATDEFYGAWTYDADLVDELCRYLTESYVHAPEESASNSRSRE